MAEPLTYTRKCTFWGVQNEMNIAICTNPDCKKLRMYEEWANHLARIRYLKSGKKSGKKTVRFAAGS